MNKQFNNGLPIRRGIVLLVLLSLIFAATAASAAGSSWTNWGANLQNTRFQASENTINAQNVKNLVAKWVFTTAGDVSATAAVADGAVYFPDWAGFLYKVDAATGTLIWQKAISDYTGIAGSVSRTTPAIDGGTLYLGTQQGAYLLAINASDGSLIWSTQMDTHPAAQITQSPTFYNGKIFVGLASREEALATNPAYDCCTFQGSMTAVDASSGTILWRFHTLPDNGGLSTGYSGAAVWGSSPSIDPSRNAVFIATGNIYDAPQSVKDCEAARQPGTPDTCIAPDVYQDTVLSLNMDTGGINWSRRVLDYDAWTVACLGVPGHPNCPTPAGPDYDFGQAPMLFSIRNLGASRDVVGVGQKSGIFWTLDRNTGAVIWATTGGPGGTLGGMEWGSSYDGTSIYYQIGNNSHTPYKLMDQSTTTGGLWGAFDPNTGRIKWQTADPTQQIDPGPVSSANGVVYGGSFSGDFYAMDGLSGRILWNYHTTGSINSGPAIVDGVLYWGSGYAHVAGTPGNQFYAFSLP